MTTAELKPRHDELVKLYEAVKAETKGTRLEWFDAFKAHPEWKEQFFPDATPQEAAKAMSAYTTIYITKNKKPTTKKRKAQVSEEEMERRRAYQREHYRQLKAQGYRKGRVSAGKLHPTAAAVLETGQKAHEANNQPSFVERAAPSFCPNCGADLRDCKVKARIE